jgi:transposase InsO family protein
MVPSGTADDNRASTFTLILIDDYSRFVVGHGVDEGAERADLVIKTFEEAVARHGRPERVMDDKGSAFWSWRGISRFTDLLTEMGIDQVVAEKKEWNGKIEVFNGNLHKELFDVHRFYDVADMRRRLAAHLHWYNHARTHHALGGLLVPADRFYGRVEEVLARLEAGAARDAKDLLDLPRSLPRAVQSDEPRRRARDLAARPEAAWGRFARIGRRRQIDKCP